MRRIALAVAIVAYALAVLAFRPHPTPGPALRDFEAYYAAGAAWDRGDDPYGQDLWTYERRVPGVDARREGPLPFVNPPPMLPLLGLVARLPVEVAAPAWEALLLLALGVLLAAAAALTGLRRRVGWIALIPLALSFGPVSSDLALGQFALVAVAALAVGAIGLARGRMFAGSAGAFAAALQPAIALPLAAFARSWRSLHALLAAATTFALGWIVVAAFSPAAAPLRYLALLRAHDAAERFALIQYAPSAIVYGLGASDPVANAVGIACAIGAIALWLADTIRGRLTSLVSFLLACALLPFAVPFFHEHDFALLFVPALYAARTATTSLARGVAVAGALLCAIDWLGLAQRPDGALQSLLLAIAFLAALVATGGARLDRASLVGAGSAAVAFLIAAVAAHGHPAPVWPDAMAALPALPSDAPIASVWHAQQAAAHMFDPDALHALLRALPLLGCAAIGWSLVLTAIPRARSGSRNP